MGIDMTSAVSPLDNTEVLAAGAGVVVMRNSDCLAGSGCNQGWGNYVVISNSTTLFTLYAHLASISVDQEQEVTQGQRIGYMGATGSPSYSPHLHFEVLTSQPTTTADLGFGYASNQPANLGHPDPRDYFVKTPVRVNAASVNVWSRPDSDPRSIVVARISRNQEFVATSQSARGWFFIYLPSKVIPSPKTQDDDRYGWVSGEFLTGDLPPPALVTVDGARLWRHGRTDLPVRSGPGTNFDELTKVWGGQSFVTFGRPTYGPGSNTPWYEIHIPQNAGSSAGWIPGDDLVVGGIDDGFESYSAGSFPSPAWTRGGNTAIAVDDATSAAGNNSLRLFGRIGSCWGSVAHRAIPVRPPFAIDFDVRNGTEALSGCHSTYGWIALNSDPSWSSQVRYLMAFVSENGQKRIRGVSALPNDGTDPDGIFGPDMGAFESLRWYKTSITYEPVGEAVVRIRYWVNGVLRGQFEYPALPYERDLVFLSLWAGEGTAWFDNVSIRPLVELTLGLDTQDRAVISWSAIHGGYVLEVSSMVDPLASWYRVLDPTTEDTGRNWVTSSRSAAAQFYRLRRP